MVVTKDFIFLNNPRTGSRACVRGFIKLGLVPEETEHYHANPLEIPFEKPKYAIIRNTVDWAYSHYLGFYSSKPFVDWINQSFSVLEWAPNRLNCYDGYVDRYFLYEWGIESIFNELGLEIPNIPLVGSSKGKTFERKSEYDEMILRKFEKDEFLYQSVLRHSTQIKYIEPPKNREEFGPEIRGAVAGG